MTSQNDYFLYNEITSDSIFPFILEEILDSSDSDSSSCENNSTSEDEEYLSDMNDDEINDFVLFSLAGRNLASKKFNFSQNNTLDDHWTITDSATSAKNVNIQTPFEAFSLIFDENILNIIVNNTNMEATSQNELNWKLCDTDEIRAYLGVLIIIGYLKITHLSPDILWHEKFGPSIFRSVFDLKRYKNFNRYLRFDDKSTRKARKINDRLAPIRNLFDQFNKNLLEHFTPGENLTVDEQFVPFDGNCVFKQCVTTEPAQYGFKIWWLCDTMTGYPLRGFPHVDKTTNDTSENYYDTVIKYLCTPFYKTNRNVTLNETFSNINLAQYLFKQGVTVTGRISKQCDDLPKQFLNTKERAIHSCVYGLHENVILLSYMEQLNEPALFLSTRHNHNLLKYMFKNQQNDTTTTNIEIPEVIQYYHNHQLKHSITHVVNQYTTRQKRKQWPFILFYNLVDIAGIAAYQIYQNQKLETKYKSRYHFLVDLANSLIEPLLKRSGIELNENSTGDQHSGQCYLCKSMETGGSVTVVKCCETCGVNVCKEHSSSIVICNRCFGK